MRTQPQFDNDTDREDRIALEVMKDGLKIDLVLFLSLLIMAGIEYVRQNADQIDAKVEHRINQVMK